MLWLCIRLPPLPLEPLTRLAWWAQQWSSQVSLRTADEQHADAVLWLEIGASLRLLGDAQTLCEAVRSGLAELDYRGQLAIAPTPCAALLLTRLGTAPIVRESAELTRQLAPLPLRWLDLPAAAIAALHAAGLRRIGELLEIPAAAIARRFGPHASRYLRYLRGQEQEPLRSVMLPSRYDGRCDFEADVELASALLFPLQRLLGELQGYLRARDAAIQRCTLRLSHPRGQDSQLTLRTSRPGRDAAQWLTLAREQLANLQLEAPVRALHLTATELMAPLVLQEDFFSREGEQAQQLTQTLDRLLARLGSGAVTRLDVYADHRPEHAWCTTDAAALPPRGAPPAATDATRPCWMLQEPLPIEAPPLVTAPERIESGWWDGGDVARDYYLARAADGSRQWVFQDLRSGRWFLQGLWA